MAQLLCIHTLTKSVSLSPLDATLTRPSRKSIKTRDFNSFRIRSYSTPSRNNLIRNSLTKHGGRREGGLCFAPSTGHERPMRVPTRRDGSRHTGSVLCIINLLCLLRSLVTCFPLGRALWGEASW